MCVKFAGRAAPAFHFWRNPDDLEIHLSSCAVLETMAQNGHRSQKVDSLPSKTHKVIRDLSSSQESLVDPVVGPFGKEVETEVSVPEVTVN